MYGYASGKEDYLQRLRRIEGQVRGDGQAVTEGGDVATEKVREASDAIARLVRS